MLSEIRHYVNQKTLKAIYHAICESRIILTLRLSYKKALRFMFFLIGDAYANPLFKDFNILKFNDKIVLENSILIRKSFKQERP